MIIATTRRIWTKPPSVKDVTTPKSHRIKRMTATVYNMIVK